MSAKKQQNEIFSFRHSIALMSIMRCIILRFDSRFEADSHSSLVIIEPLYNESTYIFYVTHKNLLRLETNVAEGISSGKKKNVTRQKNRSVLNEKHGSKAESCLHFLCLSPPHSIRTPSPARSRKKNESNFSLLLAPERTKCWVIKTKGNKFPQRPITTE